MLTTSLDLGEKIPDPATATRIAHLISTKNRILVGTYCWNAIRLMNDNWMTMQRVTIMLTHDWSHVSRQSVLLLHMVLGTEPGKISGESTTLGGTFSMLWLGGCRCAQVPNGQLEHPSTSRVPWSGYYHSRSHHAARLKLLNFLMAASRRNAQRQPPGSRCPWPFILICQYPEPH